MAETLRLLPQASARAQRYPLPVHGAIGLALIGVAWPASWLQVAILGQYAFFSLWLGYILTVDALVLRRTETSILARSPVVFLGMFLFSVPAWWLFEGINHLTQNWHYLGAEEYSTLRYVLVASWHFSTVTPAVFETAELVGSLRLVARFQRGPALPVSRPALVAAVALGLVLLLALVAWPGYAYPATWVCVFLLLDPVNALRRQPSVLESLRRGDWRLVVVMGLGAIVCGWFWEMWNYWALPKWYYTIPFADWARVFEMPLLVYGGYLPFGLEVFAMYHFMRGVVGWPSEVYGPGLAARSPVTGG